MTTPNPSDGELEALLLCPFCGSAASLEVENDGGCYVQCDRLTCRASTNIRYSEMEDARPLQIEQWNRRITSAVARELLELAAGTDRHDDGLMIISGARLRSLAAKLGGSNQ